MVSNHGRKKKSAKKDTAAKKTERYPSLKQKMTNADKVKFPAKK